MSSEIKLTILLVLILYRLFFENQVAKMYKLLYFFKKNMLLN